MHTLDIAQHEVTMYQVGHLEIFWSRVPIFLLGINFGSMVKNRHTIDGQAVWMLAAIWILTFGTCLYLEQIRHGHFPLFVERMLFFSPM